MLCVISVANFDVCVCFVGSGVQSTALPTNESIKSSK